MHGGVRYLEKAVKEFDYGQWELVKEALSERSVFLDIAPYLAYQLPIMLPVYTCVPDILISISDLIWRTNTH